MTTRVYLVRRPKRSNRYVVAWYDPDGSRQRATVDSPDEAKRIATEKARDGARGVDSAPLTLTGAERHAYEAAKARIAQLGMELPGAMAEFAEARQYLPANVSLVTAAKEYLRRNPGEHSAPDLDTIIVEFLEAKRRAGRSDRYLNDLDYRLERFRTAFRMPISSVTVPLVERWLESLNVGPRSRSNFLTCLTTLFSFCERRKWIAKGSIDLSEIERGRSEGQIEVFTPEELRQILAASSPRMVAFIALGAFAGIRSAEICRLRWRDIGPDYVEVRAANAKTRSRRIVPIQPVLASWLEPLRADPDSPAMTLLKPDHHLHNLATRAKVKWKRNGLRHSFGSYRLALTKNEGQVALEMGNSPAMIFQHYRAVVTEEQARAWFAVGPPIKAAPPQTPPDTEPRRPQKP